MNLFLFALLLTALKAVNFHDVIVVGAGISGISASKILNQNHIDHIILEGRDRIGGRIFSSDLDGQQIDYGASFVHNPGPKNSIYNLLKELHRPFVPANASITQQLSLNRYSLNKSENQDFSKGVKELQSFIHELSKEKDTDLETAWYYFRLKNGYKYSKEVLTRIHFQLTMEGSVNGADLKKISAHQYITNTEKNSQDVLPVGGYESLLKTLYWKCCNQTKIYFNHFVAQIDYYGDVIKVTTKDGQHFYSKKIIVSVPLGVLKRGVIDFKPHLPPHHRQAISRIGFGVFNKVIVTFQQRFWKKDSKILNFIANDDEIHKYQQCYVVKSTPKVNLVMFLVAGSKSLEVSKMTNKQIAQDLAHSLQKYVSYPVNVKNITVTRWEEDKFSYGSYSYYKVGTKRGHFQIMRTPIYKKLWFIGEHTHPKYSSNVHGAFDSGRYAALEVVKLLSKSQSGYQNRPSYQKKEKKYKNKYE